MNATSERSAIRARWPSLAALVVALACAPVYAQQATRQISQFAMTRPNPCPPPFDEIPFQGTTTTVLKDGIIIHEGTHASGIGDPSGLKYNFGDRLNQRFKLPPGGAVIARQVTTVVSQGAADNFFATIVTRIDANGNTQTEVNEECRG